jgi:hypothetical protein
VWRNEQEARARKGSAVYARTLPTGEEKERRRAVWLRSNRPPRLESGGGGWLWKGGEGHTSSCSLQLMRQEQEASQLDVMHGAARRRRLTTPAAARWLEFCNAAAEAPSAIDLWNEIEHIWRFCFHKWKIRCLLALWQCLLLFPLLQQTTAKSTYFQRLYYCGVHTDM